MNIYSTVAQMEAVAPSSAPALAYCKELGATFRYVEDARYISGSNTAPTDDNLNILSTGAGGNTRWLNINARPYCVFDKNSAGTQASGTSDNKITWAAKADPFLLGDLSNERFGGAGVANGIPLGLVFVNGQYHLTSTTDGNSYTIRIFKNGTDVKSRVRRGVTGGASLTVEVSGLIPITATTDYIELYSDTQNSLTISDTPRLTFLEIYYVQVTDWREP